MNKQLETQNKPTKKMQNPFMKYKDVEAKAQDFSVDTNYFLLKELSKKFPKNETQKHDIEMIKIQLSEYSSEQKTYLFKKMYNEFENHLENGKKLVDNLIRSGVAAAGAIGISVLTQMNSLKAFTTGIAVGCGIYAIKRISEYLGEKKAIKEIENMMDKK